MSVKAKTKIYFFSKLFASYSEPTFSHTQHPFKKKIIKNPLFLGGTKNQVSSLKLILVGRAGLAPT